MHFVIEREEVKRAWLEEIRSMIFLWKMVSMEGGRGNMVRLDML